MNSVQAGSPKGFARDSAIYLNNASVSPMPEQSVQAVGEFLEKYSAAGPDSEAGSKLVEGVLQGARRAVSQIIGCRPEEIALTQSTTDGVNAVAGGLQMPEDSVVIVRGMRHEHHANLYPWMRLGQKRVASLPVDESGLFGMAELRRMLAQKKAGLATLSHALYNTGAIMPVEEAGELLEAQNVPYFVDAAQTVGCVDPVDVNRIRCTFMAFNGSKWLCGPMGTGFFYCKRGAAQALEPAAVGGESAMAYEGQAGLCLAYKDAPDKFQAGFRNYAGMAGLTASAKIISEYGIRRIQEKASALAQMLRDEIGAISGAKIYGPALPGQRTSIVSFSLPGTDPEQAVARLERQGIVLAVREICDKKIIRASPHFFNTIDEIRQTASAIRSL